MNKSIHITTNLTNVKKIIHLADVHIRLYKRHEEYEQVFNNLYDSIKKYDLTDTIIVVAGDLVHAKTDLSPEMVRVASEFLRNLSNIVPTIVIAGNHDLSITNPNRLDSISPIVENLRHKDLFYFRESGIYNFANVQFAVHSLIGSSEEWPSISDLIPSKKRIALFHGPVNKAQTDIGFSVTNRTTVESFDGYDMVLLGDIHKTQILQEHSIGKPEIAYCGSLCQQNHGESLSGHGYLIWDVEQSKVSDFIEVPNSYGYYTITLNDNKTPDITKIPENVRLRLFVGDIDTVDIKRIISIIRKDHNVLESSINKIPTIKQITNGISTNILDDVNNITQQNAHIKTYVESHCPDIEDAVIDKIIDINTKLNARIGDDELPKNISWCPIRLKFDNLFSYGAGNEINFADMKGLYGVFSPNATGKTSAFDALCFALYDKTPRAFKGSHIMNTRCDTFSCELEIEIENVHYIIERTGSRKKNGEVKVDVDFWKIENDIKISLNEDDRRNTNSTIRSYVGSYDDFILTALSVQGQNSLFIETGQSDRKDLLSQFIGLTIFDRLFNFAVDEIKEISGALKSFKKDDFTQTLADIQNSLDKLNSEHHKKSDELSEYKQKLEVIVVEIKRLYKILTPNIKLIDPAPIISEIESTKILLDMAGTKMDNIKYDMAICRKERDLNSVMDMSTLKKRYDEFLNAKDDLQKLRYKLNVFQVDLKNKQSHLEKLKIHKYDPNCEYCMNNIFVKDSIALKIEHSKLMTSISELETDIYNGEQYNKSREAAEVEYKEAADSRDRYFAKDADYKTLSIQFEKAENTWLDFQKRLNDLNQSLLQYDVDKQIIEENRIIQQDIDKLESSEQNIQFSIKSLDIDLMKLHGQLEVFRKTKDGILKNIKDAEELESNYEAYEVYLSTIGRDGLPYELISQIIPNLQLEVNNILEQIVDFSVCMDVDGKNINGKIVYEDNRTWPLELASGMEKFVTGLAIRVALMSVSNLPKSNFLVVDEGFSTLDVDNLSSMSLMFDILSNKFDFILIISHLDSMRDIVDTLIEIKRSDDFSYITVK